MVIIDGWRKATAIARAALEASSLDHGSDPVAFRADLMNIARTSEFYLFNHYFNTLFNRLTPSFSPSLSSLISFFHSFKFKTFNT